jgi:hypothetical protein
LRGLGVELMAPKLAFAVITGVSNTCQQKPSAFGLCAILY